MPQIAFRIDIQTRESKAEGELILRNLNRHTWEVEDVFTYGGREWTVDAVLVRFRDSVPYPAEAQCLLIAGDKSTRSSVIVDANDVVLVESEA